MPVNAPVWVVATWRFGERAVAVAREVLAAGGCALDAVERGISVVELDPSEHSVGLGGRPNSQGVVELDAGIMWGPGRRVGAVAGLRGVADAISAARLVMERTPHCMLVGEGARRFALAQGLRPRRLLTPEARRMWREWLESHADEDGHDTIGMVAVDVNGDVCAATSTSGIGYKLPGRVGDSPLVGSGFYADNVVGGAAATGLGERILRYCMSFRVVEAMRQGLHPQAACESVVRFMLEDDPTNADHQCAVLALDRQGRFGGASTQPEFVVAYAGAGELGIVEAPHLAGR